MGKWRDSKPSQMDSQRALLGKFSSVGDGWLGAWVFVRSKSSRALKIRYFGVGLITDSRSTVSVRW